MTTTHIMSDETGQLILAQLQAISQALDDGALSNSQIDTVLADQSPTGAGFLDGGGLKRFFDGLQAQFADISHNHSGDALTPASVAATGAVSGSSISDGTGTLAQLRESVSTSLLHTYTTNGITARVYRCANIVMVTVSGSLANSSSSSNWMDFGSVPRGAYNPLWFCSGRIIGGQRIDFIVDNGLLRMITRTILAAGTDIYHTFCYICAE